MKNTVNKNNLDPTSPNYNEKVKNKANEKTPTSQKEPSSHTTINKYRKGTAEQFPFYTINLKVYLQYHLLLVQLVLYFLQRK